MFNAVLCATVSIPSANPDTMHISVFENPSRIFLKLFFAFSLAFLEPTTASVLSKLHSDNSHHTNNPVGALLISLNKTG